MTEAPLKIVPVYLRADQLRILIDALRDIRERLDRERDADPAKHRAGVVGQVLDEQTEINRMLSTVLEAKLSELTAPFGGLTNND